jgi:hypothetical protein
VITGAALIIIAVFAGFASGDLVESQQVGFGRLELVPAQVAAVAARPHVEHEAA